VVRSTASGRTPGRIPRGAGACAFATGLLLLTTGCKKLGDSSDLQDEGSIITTATPVDFGDGYTALYSGVTNPDGKVTRKSPMLVCPSDISRRPVLHRDSRGKWAVKVTEDSPPECYPEGTVLLIGVHDGVGVRKLPAEWPDECLTDGTYAQEFVRSLLARESQAQGME